MPITILLIDDEPRVLQSFARNVRLAGHRVITAGNGAEGLKLYHQELPEIVITDLRMAGLSGQQVLEAIRAHDPEANVILCTGHGDQDAILGALRAGASDFLSKPVDQISLESALCRAVEQVHLKRELRASQEALREQNAQLEETVRARTAELADALAKYRVLFDAFPLGITVADAEGQILESNQESERLLGLSPEEHTQRQIDGAEWRIIRLDGSPMPADEYASVRALQTQELVRNVEMGIVKGAEAVTWISVTAAPLNDDRVVITYNDVTQRQRAEAALRESEARYRRAQQLGHVGNWEYNLQTQEFWGSEEAKRIYGFAPDTEWFTTEEVERCIPERARVHQALLDLIERDQEYRLEFDILTRDTQERRTLLSVAELERDAAGQPWKVTGVIQDITERKQAEDALRESEERYRLLIENQGEGLGIVDPDEYFTFVNPAGEDIFGVPRGSLVGRNLDELVCPEGLARIRQETAARRAGEQSQYELKIVRPDEQQRYISVTATPRLDAQGQFTGTFGIFRDITDRKQAEDALRESEARYRLITDHTSDSIWAMDAELRFTYQSPAAARLFGYTFQEWQTLDWNVFVHPADMDAVMQVFESLQSQGANQAAAVSRVRHKNGRELWVEFIASAIRGEDGALKQIVGVTRDITERKRAEAALLEERERLDNILAALETGLSLITPDMTIAWVNRKIREMFPGDEPVGQICYHFYEGRETLCDHCGTRPAFQTGEVQTCERQNPVTGRWYAIIAQPIRDEQGQIVNVLESITDITERKQMEVAQRESELFLNTLLDAIPIPIFYKDREGRYLGFNHAFELFFGETRERLIGKSVFDISPPELAEIYAAQDNALLEKGGLQRYESQVKDAQGVLHAVIFNKAVFTDSQGAVRGLIGGILDITDRKRAEAALRDSEERFKSLTHDVLDSSEVGIFILDAAFKVVWINQAVADYFELDRAAILHQDKRQAIREHIQFIFADSQRFTKKVLATYDDNTYIENFECHVLPGESRQERWLEHWSQPIRSGLFKGGRIEHYYDITDRKQMETALHASETRFRTLFEATTEGVILHEMVYDDVGTATNYRILDVNPAFERHTGISVAAIRGKLATEAYGTDDPPYFNRYAHVAATGQPTAFETYFPPLQRHFYIAAFSPEPGQFATVFQDITARKQAEAALRESERNLLEAQTIAQLGRWELDVSTDQIDWSPTIYEIFELDPEQFPPSYESFLAVIHPDDRESVNQAYLNSLDDRQPYDIEHRLLLPSGRIKWLHEICRTYYDDQGQPLRSVGVVQDITRRKKMELQLQAYADLLQEYTERLEEMVEEKVQELEAAHAKVIQMDKMASLGQLATGVAHELNQPLTAIGFDAAYLIMLAQKAREQDAARVNLDELETVGQGLEADLARAQRITDHLRAFGRVADETLNFIDLNQPLEDSLILIEAQLRDNRVTVDWQLAEDLPYIEANPHKLEQVFINLIGNAEYAMQAAAEQDGRAKILTLSTRCEGDWIVAEVRDNGCGISEATQKRLFEPFFTTKPEGDGTGLGLSICYGIVTGCGGEIACESAPGAGTAFILRFPVAPTG